MADLDDGPGADGGAPATAARKVGSPGTRREAKPLESPRRWSAGPDPGTEDDVPAAKDDASAKAAGRGSGAAAPAAAQEAAGAPSSTGAGARSSPKGSQRPKEPQESSRSAARVAFELAPPTLKEPAPPALSLGAGNPALGLAEALLAHPALAPRGSPGMRTVGAGAVAVGLLAVAADRRILAMGDGPTRLGGALLWHVGAALVALGLILWLLFVFVPRRRVHVRGDTTQVTEWKRVTAQVRRHSGAAAVAYALVVLGPALLVVAYDMADPDVDVTMVGAGAVLLAAGAAMAIALRARRTALRRLYMQTFMLHWIETSGIVGGEDTDARYRSILMEIDRLFGSLPEAQTREFFQTRAGRQYLDLMEDWKSP